jgi:hypothetical protein
VKRSWPPGVIGYVRDWQTGLVEVIVEGKKRPRVMVLSLAAFDELMGRPQ